ncbi:hypothetical protein EDD21DRAFT_362635 [Dissophora ornata]|nr:hypothetical protein EDD21DRAFT_362635 [Dissophora ornata]
MKTYFKLDYESRKVMTDDGWFNTGDIGTMNPDGTLSIKDRIKNFDMVNMLLPLRSQIP